jgi:hypothetical protein
LAFRIEVIEFHKGPAPKGFKKDFESFLFNSHEHRLTQSKTGWLEFHLLEKSKRKIVASVAFHVKGETARSPLLAPFGSYEFSEKVPKAKLLEFIDSVDQTLKKAGVQKVEIINHPEGYFKLHNILAFTLIHCGYSPLKCDVNCSIKVDKTPLVKKMNKGKRKQFRQSLKNKLLFKKIPVSKVNTIYDFIASCREEKRQSLSLTKTEISKIIKSVSKSFLLTGVYKDKELVAASICVKVTKNILYTFYSAHTKKYDAISPLTFLLANLYNWCFEKGYTVLDMGTSSIDGKPNFNLLDFKLRVGGTMSPKFSFRKML